MRELTNATAQIVQLALSLLALTLQVLFAPLLLQVLIADQITNSLLAGADGLIPRAFAAIRIVFGDGACGGPGEGADFGGRVRGIVFSVCFVLTGIAAGLKEWALA